MPASVRNVLARYREEPQNMGPFEEDTDWVSYLKDKAQVSTTPSNVILKMMDKGEDKYRDTMRDTNKGISVNPYDYQDPTTSPKDQKDSAPFENIIPEEIDIGHINSPQVFEEDSALDFWQRVREEDWTSDVDQQSPAMSEDRTPGAGRAACILKQAASLEEVLAKDTHYNNNEKIRKAGEVTANLVGQQSSRDTGLYSFRAKSPSGIARKVNFQFLRPNEGTAQPKSLLEYPVQLSCNCESFLFHGAQYYAIHDMYLYGPGIPSGRRNRNIAPTPKDQVSSNRFTPRKETTPNLKGRANPGRGVNFRVCKHILAAYNVLAKMPDLVQVKKPFVGFPVIGPPLPLFDKEMWNDLMGFEFNKQNVHRKLKGKKPVTPPFFRSRSISRKFIEWMRDVWLPRTDDEKVRVLQTIIEHPEEIYLILLKDAYYTGGKTSDYLIATGFDLMDRVVQARTPTEKPSEDKIEELKKEEEESAKTDIYPSDEVLEDLGNQKEEFIENPKTKKEYEKEEDKGEGEEDKGSPAKVEDRIEDVKGVSSPSSKEDDESDSSSLYAPSNRDKNLDRHRRYASETEPA